MKPPGRAKTPRVIDGRFGSRPLPPGDLTPRQATIWRDIVSSEHPAYFGTAVLRGLLADLCRRRATAADISGIIDAFDSRLLNTAAGIRQYKKLLTMRDLETRGVVSLLTKLRLTNQARLRPAAAASKARNAPFPGPLPWERGDDPA